MAKRQPSNNIVWYYTILFLQHSLTERVICLTVSSFLLLLLFFFFFFSSSVLLSSFIFLFFSLLFLYVCDEQYQRRHSSWYWCMLATTRHVWQRYGRGTPISHRFASTKKTLVAHISLSLFTSLVSLFCFFFVSFFFFLCLRRIHSTC